MSWATRLALPDHQVWEPSARMGAVLAALKSMSQRMYYVDNSQGPLQSISTGRQTPQGRDLEGFLRGATVRGDIGRSRIARNLCWAHCFSQNHPSRRIWFGSQLPRAAGDDVKTALRRCRWWPDQAMHTTLTTERIGGPGPSIGDGISYFGNADCAPYRGSTQGEGSARPVIASCSDAQAAPSNQQPAARQARSVANGPLKPANPQPRRALSEPNQRPAIGREGHRHWRSSAQRRARVDPAAPASAQASAPIAWDREAQTRGARAPV